MSDSEKVEEKPVDAPEQQNDAGDNDEVCRMRQAGILIPKGRKENTDIDINGCRRRSQR